MKITFDCLPLRTLGRLDPPLDAGEEVVAFYHRLRAAIDKHGVHNSYYLHNVRCQYYFTNDPQVGMVEFALEGTVLTDANDMHTRDADFNVWLEREVCDWLTASAVEWLAECARRAVRVEFDRYIAVGDLQRTVERLEQIRLESDAQGGFLGMGL